MLASEDRGVQVRWVDFHFEDGTLNLEDLHRALEEKPRLVAVGYASNALGTINPVEEITRWSHEAGALVYVDAVQYEQRRISFDFDMIVNVWGQSLSPGNEQREFWSSAAADQPGSRNLVGLKNPAVDRLVDQVIAAPARASLVTRVRALDRALQWNYLVIPHWHIPYARLAFWDKFGYPAVTPLQGVQLEAWWIDRDKDAALAQRRSGSGKDE